MNTIEKTYRLSEKWNIDTRIPIDYKTTMGQIVEAHNAGFNAGYDGTGYKNPYFFGITNEHKQYFDSYKKGLKESVRETL